MANHYANGRRAPSVSQYLANLNTVPSSQEMAAAQNNDFEIGGDLDFLTNTEFFDFDNFQGTSNNAAGLPQGSRGHSPRGPGYQFGEFQAYPPTLNSSPNSVPTSPTNVLQGAYPPQPLHSMPYSANTGDKRRASQAGMPSASDLEETSRLAAEEDKRRRNTAASARFRVKKEQREQALEKQAKEMTDKVSQLEAKVQQLEMENKWLKELITEKGDKIPTDGSERQEDKDSEERSTESRTDGVGTFVKA